MNLSVIILLTIELTIYLLDSEIQIVPIQRLSLF